VTRRGIGIDFGTTNSAAAVYDGDELALVQLEGDGSIMPSATYIDRDLQSVTGQLAIDRYIGDNTGRTVELIPEVVGETSKFVEHGDGDELAAVETVTQKIYGAPVTDSGLNGRLFRGTKRLLGDERVRRLMVFDQPFRLVALITPLLLRMAQSIERDYGSIGPVHLGHPVNFEGREMHKNRLALSRLGEAYKYAGVEYQSFYPEPVAAAVSFLHSQPDIDGEHLLTLDFGGGTLDFCVLARERAHLKRNSGSSLDSGLSSGLKMGFKVVATHGIGLGGDHIDQLLYRKLLFPLFGQGEMWRRRGFDREIETRFPFEDFADLLLNWAVTYTLNQNRFTTPVMECIAQGGSGKRKFERLRDVIKHNLSYLLYAFIKDFKATLSSQESARLDISEIDIDITMSRIEFEALIEEPLQQVARALDATVAKANLRADQIDIVLGTGGSSLIPAVKRLLEDRFPNRVFEHDPFTSVAAGLAVASFHGYNFA
jgi:hypothetical chaperone protein